MTTGMNGTILKYVEKFLEWYEEFHIVRCAGIFMVEHSMKGERTRTEKTSFLSEFSQAMFSSLSETRLTFMIQ